MQYVAGKGLQLVNFMHRWLSLQLNFTLSYKKVRDNEISQNEAHPLTT